MGNPEPAGLSVRGVSKHYAVQVLHAVDFDLAPGEIHALLGANGAGKSTLCKIIAGLIRASAGAMTLDGSPYAPRSKSEAERSGVQTVHQELNLIPTLSVAENLFLNRLPHRLGCLRTGLLEADARVALARVGLQDIDPRCKVESLGVGTRQLIEIAAALVRYCRVLLLDEPTSALTGGEVERLFDRLRELRAAGVGIVYISHRLDEIQAISDRITILRDGRKVRTLATSETTPAQMTALMTGDETPLVAGFQSHRRTETALRVVGMRRDPSVLDVSFEVHQGERFGISGLVGSGRTELLRAVFGADPADAGAVYLGDDTTPHRFAHPSEAVSHGLAFVTEDRKLDGLLLTQPVRVNTTIAGLGTVANAAGVLSRLSEAKTARKYVTSLDTRCQSIEQAVGELSGGNQQKVAIAKWLHRDADVFLFDEPTRGIDVAARHRIYKLLEALAAAGRAIVVVSSDLEELMAMCDVIAVMARGRMVARFGRGGWTRGGITAAGFAVGDARQAMAQAEPIASPNGEAMRVSATEERHSAPNARACGLFPLADPNSGGSRHVSA